MYEKNSVFVAVVTGCSEERARFIEEEYKIASTDIILNHSGELTNEKLFDAFVENAKKEVNEIRILAYTHEGDPIITDYHVEKGVIKVIEDWRPHPRDFSRELGRLFFILKEIKSKNT